MSDYKPDLFALSLEASTVRKEKEKGLPRQRQADSSLLARVIPVGQLLTFSKVGPFWWMERKH